MNHFLLLTVEPLRNVFSRFSAVLPNLLAMFAILLVGFVSAGAVRALVQFLLTAVGFDRWSDRSGFTSLLRKAEVWARPAQAVALLLYWILVLIAFLAGLAALNASIISAALSGILGYLPRLLTAVLILVVGSVVAGLVSRALLISLVNSGFGPARHYARAARFLMFVVLIAMALEELQIAPGIVLAAFSIVFGGIVLALAIACGIAGVDIVKKMIERHTEETEVGSEQ